MKQYHTSIEIHASVQKVWTILTDFSDYPNWNPLVSALTGDIKEGGMIRTTIVPMNNTFSAKLLSFKENKEIVWQGKNWLLLFWQVNIITDLFRKKNN